ncbi:2-amino-4-hydroxy-6-hydroxymethyldihydropteridine diphosphokinase [Kaistella montana]|uniref:2-amino-4-hydroxy-6-hydroxymethyldihydropteridine pyrophosphokinase n=1 Tax=Kaistella montana TaxID=1849733 RepID=A0ABW5KAB3_9FLAO|nr:2-amino-4-hydroxy-6-hydroxymethyldihydropteridine diphosphokinase [Kaistella montana]MCQ4036087.1 2-amino-4-hydroxy-6-hydroxymethyldihydropteridine diphosphokinase [Kaistella montana]
MSQHKVTLLLGSNLGDSEINLKVAIKLIEEKIGTVLALSEIIHSEPVEFVSNNNFCNIALILNTQFSPIKLLNIIKRIENEMGRIEDSSVTKYYTDRIIDIDIVQYGQLIFDCSKLQIPHIRHLYQREFSRKLLESIESIISLK